MLFWSIYLNRSMIKVYIIHYWFEINYWFFFSFYHFFNQNDEIYIIQFCNSITTSFLPTNSSSPIVTSNKFSSIHYTIHQIQKCHKLCTGEKLDNTILIQCMKLNGVESNIITYKSLQPHIYSPIICHFQKNNFIKKNV